MSVNKYVRRKQGRGDSDHDILGIVLIIISAFLLLCSIIPIMFGVVGEVIRNILLGLFGLSTYAILALILASGIGLLLHRKLDVRWTRLALVAGIAVSTLLILQLATTNWLMEHKYGAYLIAVYQTQITAGGLVFGVFAYGVKMLINLAFAYVLFSTLFVGCAALLGISIYKQYKQPDSAVSVRITQKKDDVGDSRTPKSFTDDVPAQRVHMHSPTRLFVESIVPKNNESEDFDPDRKIGNLENDAPVSRNIDQTFAFKMLYDESQGVTRKVSEYDEQFIKNKAQSELYVTDYYDKKDRKNSIAPASAESVPDIHIASESEIKAKKPDKILHESKKMPDIVIPKQKDENDGFYNPGKIMNNDEAVRGGIISQSSVSDIPNEPTSTKNFGFYNSSSDSGIAKDGGALPYGFDNGNRKNDNYSVFDKPTKKEEPENSSPIINSEFFSRFVGESVSEEQKEQEEKKSFYNAEEGRPVELYDSFSAFGKTNDKPSDKQKEKAPVINPIVSSFDFEQFEKIEDKKQKDEKPTEVSEPQIFAKETTSFSDNLNNDTFSITEKQPNSFKTDSFMIDDTVIDLSEHREFSGEDNTGYYESEPIEEIKPIREKKKTTPQVESVSTNNSDLINIPRPSAPYHYNYPPVSLLSTFGHENIIDTDDIENKSRDIEEVLASLKFPAKVVNVISGPTVTRYELQPQGGIPVRKILSLDKDLEFTLARGAIRIEAPVANKQAIGIEVANNTPSLVHFREIVESPSFNDSKFILPLALGKDIGGDAIVRNLEKMPHLLIAGTTGTGKSVCLNTLILSLVYKCSPDDVRIVLVDPKQVEFTLYRELPHLLLRNPITDVEYAINALDWLIEEMNRRYDIFSNIASKGLAVRNLAEYNNCSLVKEGKAMKMPCIVMIVDELADLMSLRKKDVENRIRIITQKSRASGIHLVLATQRPSVDVITGTIKINLPSRIAFKVTANADSRTILDQGGAEALLGNGDMLLMSNAEPIRLQGAYVSNEEIVSVVDYIKKNNEACFDETIEKTILAPKEQAAEIAGSIDSDEESADEKLFPDIMRCLITNGTASTSLLQRRFSLGYSRASRIIDVFEQRKWVGPSAGAKPREVYMTETLFETVFGRDFNE